MNQPRRERPAITSYEAAPMIGVLLRRLGGKVTIGANELGHILGGETVIYRYDNPVDLSVTLGLDEAPVITGIPRLTTFVLAIEGFEDVPITFAAELDEDGRLTWTNAHPIVLSPQPGAAEPAPNTHPAPEEGSRP